MGRILSVNGEKISNENYQLALRYWTWASEAMEKKLEKIQIEKLIEQNMIQLLILEQKAVEMGISEFTKEERRTIQSRAEYFWNETVNHYKKLFLREKKAFSDLEAFQKAERFLNENGYSIRQLAANKKTEILYDRMMRLYEKKVKINREEISKEMNRRMENGETMNLKLLEKVKRDLTKICAKEMLQKDLKEWILQSKIVREEAAEKCQ